MRLSVGEAIASGRLNGVELIAGLSGLHNVVTGVTILHHWQDWGIVHRGDLVVLDINSDAIALPFFLELVSQLSDNGTAAVIIHKLLLCEEVKEKANQCGLPILEVADDEWWQRVVSSAQRDLLLTQIEIYERVQEIHNALTRAVINGHGLDEIAQVLSNLIQNPVVIENDRFEVLAWSNGGAKPDEVRRRVIEERKVPAVVLEVLARHGVLQRINTEKKPFRVSPIEPLRMQARVMAPILVGSIRYGHISIAESNHPLGELDLMAIEQAATLVALQFSLQHVIKERKQRLEENLVYDILFSRDQDETTIQQRANFLGYIFKSRYTVVIIDVDNFSAVIQQEKWYEATIQDIKDTLKHQVRASLSFKDRSALVASGGDALIVLYPLDDAETLEAVKGYVRRLQKQMLDIFPRLSFSIGIGRVCEQIGELSQSHRDALSAVSAGRAVRGNGSLTVYDELGIYSLLVQYQDTGLLNTYVERTIGQLIAYDSERNTDLINTLRVYFSNGGNKNQTAQDLYIHINTVKYRLQKISELTGVDFDNPDDMLNLHLGIKIADMERLKFIRKL